ncbi:MAG: septation ring formation regulator EzrA [Betaproteobacteria bacterium]|jgi:cell division protein FtsB|nr:septation ring formation regulator EzrA [Betaproteobacteria bacterium]NBT10851.1 septation ring formation regulator EzrA [Betaproteobacteria bacterium]NBU50309.1 septation ring formation regulator EzrA [Betaproteobacteria bacterium]
MRWITGTLLALLVLVHVDLWFSRNGVFHVRGLHSQLDEVRQQIDTAKVRNDQVQAEVRDLREGLEMVEEKARAELGMVKRDEIYIQVAPRR